MTQTLYNNVIDQISDIQVLYKDDHLLMVSKPADMLTVPGKGPEKADCMISRLQKNWPTAKVVHRLDMATSGILVVALTPTTHRELSRQFQDRQTEKHYIAVVDGNLQTHLNATEGTVDLPLITDWPNRPRQKVCFQDGKPSQTLWQIIDQQADRTRVKLTPITGRSHQLRVHMKALGHPIIGDNLYGCVDSIAKAPRLLLHAKQLTVTHPISNERLSAQMAPDF